MKVAFITAWRVLTTLAIIVMLMLVLGLASQPSQQFPTYGAAQGEITLVSHRANVNQYSRCGRWDVRCRVDRAFQGWLDSHIYGHLARVN